MLLFIVSFVVSAIISFHVVRAFKSMKLRKQTRALCNMTDEEILPYAMTSISGEEYRGLCTTIGRDRAHEIIIQRWKIHNHIFN